ncbi:ABC transporter ATP-binding protein [Salipiger mucosus]|uniref:Oligopeptide transport ATP-binding protein OppF n=1 Tax=Salipiger mucosus DSM 16094 TaxID=1123237 RepID=S9RNN0_9RHOB|nr:ABC transporter ATP-binding protein [Salipiger mucosus]EPX75574.1 Oligopeptide transport ATP-binding protein OppF [Salipiger mucosus DSM 16094]
MRSDDPILEVQGLEVGFPIRKGLFQRPVAEVKAVNGVSFSVPRGSAFGLVGESGCGKTTVARAVLQLVEPTAGRVLFDGQDVARMDAAALQRFRGKVQAVFQDPFSSLNPRMSTGRILSEPMRVHGMTPGPGIKAEVRRLLDICGLPARFADLYPHEMSGGQRQRVGIARALAMNPELIVCDEAVSALDVSIQAQVVNLLEELQKELGLTYLFIGHDLSVVRHLCDEVAVMYLGRIAETAPSDRLFAHPRHPYTQALIDAVPNPDPDFEAGREIEPLEGEVPNPADPPSGCFFHPRCRLATDHCRQEAPPLGQISSGHLAACWETGAITSTNHHSRDANENTGRQR